MRSGAISNLLLQQLSVFLFTALSILIPGSCGKEKDQHSRLLRTLSEKTWELYYVQKLTDASIYPIPVDWTFQLKPDKTFAFTLHNGAGTGVFDWVEIDSIHAEISFSIRSWNFQPADTAYTNRLRVVLEKVRTCNYITAPGPVLFPAPPFRPNRELLLNADNGKIYLYY